MNTLSKLINAPELNMTSFVMDHLSNICMICEQHNLRVESIRAARNPINNEPLIAVILKDLERIETQLSALTAFRKKGLNIDMDLVSDMHYILPLKPIGV